MEIKVPDLGVEKAEVSEILVAVGQTVTKDQPLMLVESAKASLEIPSPNTGIISTILVKKGDTIKEGVVLLTLTENGKTEALVSEPDLAKTVSGTEVTAPERSTVATYSSQTVSPSTTQPSIPPLENINVAKPQPSKLESNALLDSGLDAVYAGPATRMLARQMGIDIRLVTPQAANGRLVKEDIYAFVNNALAQSSPQNSPVASSTSNVARAALPLYELQKWGASKQVALPKNQVLAIKHLQHNAYIPQVTQFDLADITDLESFRQSLKTDKITAGIKITLLPFIAKAVAYALKQTEFANFNAHLMDDDASILLRDEVHLGIAMATEQGLIVPVLRQPDKLPITEIAQTLQTLQQKAGAGKLTPTELSGATFTISSLGNKSGIGFTPLVSFPQAAILGISPAKIQAVWNGTVFEPRLMLPLSLSYDHRLINGAQAADFCAFIAAYLADIRRLIL